MFLLIFWYDFSVVICYINKIKDKNVIVAVGNGLHIVLSKEMAKSPDDNVLKNFSHPHAA